MVTNHLFTLYAALPLSAATTHASRMMTTTAVTISAPDARRPFGPFRSATSSSAARGIASSSILRKGNLQSTGAASGIRIDVGGLSCPIVISSL